MKKSFALMMTVPLFALYAFAGNSNRGKMLWHEEFNKSHLDENVWTKVPRGSADWSNTMTDFDSCYTFRNGCLVLRGIVNCSMPGDSSKYLTGGVQTIGKKYFTEGRIEVRARFGSARGAWPAIWMKPRKAVWPMGGEIDIMEHLNFDTIAYQTVHSNYTHNLKQENNPPHGSTGAINRDGFNVYAVDITTDSIAFSINGRHTFSYPRIAAEQEKLQYPFTDQPFFLILGMQLGGNWVGTVNPADLPVEMEVDWVRYYALPKKGK